MHNPLELNKISFIHYHDPLLKVNVDFFLFKTPQASFDASFSPDF